MRFFSEKEKALDEAPEYNPQNYPGANGHDDTPPEALDDLQVVCPPHTTERKLMARIDLHVIPFLCILYLLAFLDRVNISNANIFGLSEELHLDRDQRYNTALVIFFVPYVLFEIPSNLFLKKFKPHVWLAGNMFLFGLTTAMQGLVQNYAGLLATRFFLGVFESGMFPGCFYLLSCWYRRGEAQKRFSFFFSSTTLAGAFGGLLAAAIGKMDGLRGYAGWRWIFLLEGALTVAVSFVFFFTLPDFPEESRWLRDDEKAYVAARLRVDQGESGRQTKITLKDVGNVFKDGKLYAAAFMYMGLIVPAYSYAYFAPGIIQSYGYGRIETQSVPPWAVAFGFCMLIATASDWAKHRFAFTMGSICVAIVGFGILISVTDNTSLQYGALFLVTSGTYTAMPLVVCHAISNFGNHTRRAVGSGFIIGYGNVGGIIATFSFVADDAPEYIRGYSICLGFTAISIVATIVYGVMCWWANRQRDRMPRDLSLTAHEKAKMGDLNPEYRYLL